MPHLVLKTEEGALSHGAQAASRSWRDKETYSPQRLQEGTQPAHLLISAQGDPCWTSEIQNHKIINLS